MTKLVVPPMPELPVSLHKPGDHLYGNVNKLREWGEQCAAIAQREAALADELAEALERARKMLGPHSMHPDAEGMLMIDCALRTYTAARQK